MHTFKTLVNLYQTLERTSRRIEKAFLLSQYLKELCDIDLKIVVLLVQGRVLPQWNSQELGISVNLLIKLLAKLTGVKESVVEEMFSKKGDLGLVAEDLINSKKQITLFSKKLTIQDVYKTLIKIPTITGNKSIDLKLSHLSKLFLNSSPLEAKYLVRIILGDLRIGIGEGILLDSIYYAFLPKVLGNSKDDVGAFMQCPGCKKIVPINNSECPNCHFSFSNLKLLSTFSPQPVVNVDSLEDFYSKLKFLTSNVFIKTPLAKEISSEIRNILEDALNVLNDFNELVIIAKNKSLLDLYNVELKPLRPVKVMLYLKAKDLRDALNTLKPPVALEYKYDGFRVNIHKLNNKIKLFTRRFEDVTNQFPDVVEFAKRYVNAKSFIIDCEVVGYDKNTGKYLPFQKISQRIKRKYDIYEMSKKYPVEVNVFDLLYLNGKTLLKEKFINRRKLLENIVSPKEKELVLAAQRIVNNLDEANEFYQESLNKGNEGVMVKALNAIYKPGKRVGYGLKVKPVMETLDLVIVGAEYGEGKRAGLLTSYILACKDENDNLLEIGKVSSGFAELDETGKETYKEITEKLERLIISKEGVCVKVKPEIVIEVAYEEIQKSPKYSSGFALRFPRLVRVRYDKSVDQISSLNYIKQLYLQQRGRNQPL